MAFVKFLLFCFLATIIIFFIWNMMKRIFFTKFYNYLQQPQNERDIPKDIPKQNFRKTKNGNLNWDAETVDYEEVKE